MAEGQGDSASETTIKRPEFVEEFQDDPNFLKWKQDDNYLRKVEENTLIPKRMRAEAKKLCHQYEEDYVECCRNHKVLLFWKCRPENRAFNECLIRQYENPELRATCTEQYLKDRNQYRRTGIPANPSARSQKIQRFNEQMEIQKQKQHQEQA